MADTSEPVCNIAGMGAELPMAVAVDSEFFSACWTSKDVDGLPFHQVKVAVPPLIPASVTAEPFPLPSRVLCDGPAALLTDCHRCTGSQAVPPAERLHRIDGNLEPRRNPAIPSPIPA